MSTKTALPGIDAAQELLGLTLEEVARAVRANPSTLYRWREGGTPNAASLERLQRLEELAAETDRALGPEDVPSWLETPASVFGGRSPREMILDGRSETVLGALLSHRHLLGILETMDGPGSGFAELMARDDLSLATKAALALLDERVEDIVRGMRTPEARSAAAAAFSTPPRVRIDGAAPARKTSRSS